MALKRLVLLVEGEGDAAAAPIHLKRLLSDVAAFNAVIPDPAPLRVGEFSKIFKNECFEWRRFLKVAAKRKDIGGCILLIDGDSKKGADGNAFCAMTAARHLAAASRDVGGGSLFSVAIVFACMEFESWLIAGASSLSGKMLPDGRKLTLASNTQIPPDTETAPRDAKKWLGNLVETGYKPARDQAKLTQLVDLSVIRAQNIRSFRRFETAIQRMIHGFRNGVHTVTPAFQ